MKRAINIIATIAIATGVLIGMSPSNILIQKAYASSTSDEKTSLSDRQLRSISLSDGDINFSASQYEYNVKVKDSVDVIKITAKPKNSDSTVSIDGSTVDENSKEGSYKEKVDLDEGKNFIKIKVEDINGKEKVYVLNIYRGIDVPDDSNEESESDNGVYIKELKLSYGNINFSKKVSQYYVNVDENVEKLDITAIPDCSESSYENYQVKINDDIVEEDDNFKKTVYLQKGENEVEVKVRDEDNDEKIYTLNINRKSSSSINTSTSNSKYEPLISNDRSNQWIVVNGWLKYNDETGNPLVNSWIYDKTTSNYYYLNAEGYRAKGWILDNNKWYYLNEISGAMETGWILDKGQWYYLDESGAWIQ